MKAWISTLEKNFDMQKLKTKELKDKLKQEEESKLKLEEKLLWLKNQKDIQDRETRNMKSSIDQLK